MELYSEKKIGILKEAYPEYTLKKKKKKTPSTENSHFTDTREHTSIWLHSHEVQEPAQHYSVVREAQEKACKRPSGVLVSCYMPYLVLGGDKLYALANINL